MIGAGAVEYQERSRLIRGGPAEIAHAAEVAFAFFAHVGDQHGGNRRSIERRRRLSRRRPAPAARRDRLRYQPLRAREAAIA